MSAPEDYLSPHAATDLIRSLQAIRRSQQRWLDDLTDTCTRDPDHLAACRRWQEQLTVLKLHIHRAENCLQHFLRLPEEMRPWLDLPGAQESAADCFRRWNRLVGPYFRDRNIDTRYRRVAQVLDPLDEAVTTDIVTDLVALAEVAETTGTALARLDTLGADDGLEERTFYHVLSPWKQHGMPALFAVLQWTSAILAEEEDV